MAVTLLVLYTRPDDPEAFEAHYRDVHVPLVRTLGGLQSFSAGRIVAAPDGGELPYYRTASLVFADQAAFDAALGSPQGQATAADFGQIAPPGSRLLVVAQD